MPEASSARSYHSGSASRIASSSTAAKPRRWITSEGGALPLRKPGIRISRARARAARLTARSTSAAGTSTSTRTREPGSSETVVSIERGTLDESLRERYPPQQAATHRDREVDREGEPAPERAGDQPGPGP